MEEFGREARDPTERALRLLSLLQSRRQWPAAELAERFGVTERTIRRDVDRLRELGYLVDATPGRAGGYRLGAGAHLPPLMFDDDEAVALVTGLRTVAGAAIAGIADTAVQALSKVEQSLPDHLRRRVVALDQSVTSLQRSHRDSDVVDPHTLSSLASACRAREEVRFDYRRRDGEHDQRLVEPHQLLSAGHLWYLIAWDLRRSDWRTFRLDRLGEVRLAGKRFVPREIPGGDAAAHLTASIASLPREFEALVAVDAPHAQVAGALTRIDHVLVASDSDTCTIRFRSDRLDSLVMDVARVGLHAGVSVLEPDNVREQLDQLSRRLGQH
ncbi:MAG: YafY family protein [Ilumatobacteraceae bacterium]